MVRGRMHGQYGKGDGAHQRRVMVGVDEGWPWTLGVGVGEQSLEGGG